MQSALTYIHCKRSRSNRRPLTQRNITNSIKVNLDSLTTIIFCNLWDTLTWIPLFFPCLQTRLIVLPGTENYDPTISIGPLISFLSTLLLKRILYIVILFVLHNFFFLIGASEICELATIFSSKNNNHST